MNPGDLLLLPLLVALLAGIGCGWFLARRSLSALREATRAELAAEAAATSAVAQARLQAGEGERARLQAELDDARAAAERLRNEREEAGRQLAQLQAKAAAEREAAADKLRLLEDARESLSLQFRNLANEILEEKSKRFTEQNQANLGQLLDPLKERLASFQKKVEDAYDTEGKERSALAEQVRSLAALNRQLDEDAKSLTAALKGQAKTQGNWGEMLLARVLEMAGLKKDVHYRSQSSHTRDDGSRAQPDVIIELPGDRRMVVDSKVSLVAYERYANAVTEDERATALKAHVESVRTHVRGLSAKRYEALYGLQSLDFVVVFVPVEPAFVAAVGAEGQLFTEAWENNVLLVSPSTLLFVVRTVDHLWRQESQNRNAQEIASRGAELYDKLSAFVADLQSVGQRLTQATQAYENAEKKLVSGKGNAIRQAEMLRQLGVKPSKALPQTLVDRAEDAEEGSSGAPPRLASQATGSRSAEGSES